MLAFSKTRAYFELLRPANVFTAVSNVWMGMILTTGGLPGWKAVGITATSALLYLAGMVLNDVFDHKVDAQERPERPIPSGRVSLATAGALGWSLLAAGVVCGWATAFFANTRAPGVLAVLLAVLIVIYDASRTKKTLGPLLMCLCRVVNVALGMSLAPHGLTNLPSTILIGIGVYIASVTMFAQTEAVESSRPRLIWSAMWAVISLAIIASGPLVDDSPLVRLQVQPFGWYVLWLVVAALVLRRMVLAILQPQPKHVQQAVGYALLSIIVIDAAICVGYAEPYWALAVLALVAPAMLLAQWFKVS